MTQSLHPAEALGLQLVTTLSAQAEATARHLIAGLHTPPRLGLLACTEAGSAAESYASRLRRTAQKFGLQLSEELLRPEQGSELTEAVRRLEDCDGVMLLRPLMAPEPDLHWSLDIEGLHPHHLAQLGGAAETLRPCTPDAAIQLLRASMGDLRGRHVLLYGHGVAVGRPLTQLLHAAGATISIISPDTPAETEQLLLHQAHGVVLACGVPGRYGPAHARPWHHVVDVGITVVDGVITGDADREVAAHVQMITPRRGGVGRLTGALLILQLARCAVTRRGGVHPFTPSVPTSEVSA